MTKYQKNWKTPIIAFAGAVSLLCFSAGVRAQDTADSSTFTASDALQAAEIEKVLKDISDEEKSLAEINARIKALENTATSTPASSGSSGGSGNQALQALLGMLGGGAGSGSGGSGGSGNPIQSLAQAMNSVGSDLSQLNPRGTLRQQLDQVIGSAAKPQLGQNKGIQSASRGYPISPSRQHDFILQTLGTYGDMNRDRRSSLDVVQRIRAATGRPTPAIGKQFAAKDKGMSYTAQKMTVTENQYLKELNALPSTSKRVGLLAAAFLPPKQGGKIQEETQEERDRKRTLLYENFYRPILAADYALGQSLNVKASDGDKVVKDMTELAMASQTQSQDMYVNSRIMLEILKQAYAMNVQNSIALQRKAVSNIYQSPYLERKNTQK